MKSLFETPHGTAMRVRCQRFNLNFEVVGRLSQRERRSFLLAIYQRINVLFTILDGDEVAHDSGWIVHRDGSWENAFRDLDRGIRLSQSLKTETEAEQLGFEIRTLRLKRGLTQESLADSAGINRSHLSQIEKGRYRARKQTIQRIFATLRDNPNNPTFDKGNVVLFRKARRRQPRRNGGGADVRRST